jgi:hypothetical protein
MFCVFVSLVDFLIIDLTKPLVHFFESTSVGSSPIQPDKLLEIAMRNWRLARRHPNFAYSKPILGISLISMLTEKNSPEVTPDCCVAT